MENEINDAQDSTEQLTKKDRRLAKKQAKEGARDAAISRRKIKKMIMWGVAILLLLGAVYVLYMSWPESRELGEDKSRSAADEGAVHLEEGTRVTYGTNPPTSGNHWPTPVLDGLYDKVQPDEGLVHSLEHGRVWISYQPDISQNVIDEIKELAEGRIRIIVTPRAANETDIALAAWTRLDTFDLENGELDKNRILDFIERYDDKGPERGIPAHVGKVYNEPWYK